MTFSQFPPNLEEEGPFGAAIGDFHDARIRAAVQDIVARFTGRSAALFSYEDVAEKLRVTGRAGRGHRTIPVEAIVGSVGRYNDFTRTFLPRLARDAERWARVKVAAKDVTELPPIEVYQIGDGYFVIDGNHRVSVARQQGVRYIDATVTEVRTRVPFSPEDSPDELIAKAEYAAFLEETGLHRVRPGADLRVTCPGQYATLENLIEVHRYFVEVAEEREIPFSRAVGRWYDEAYLPVVEAIREREILSHFPGRTETDFYVWVALHQAALQNELGWTVRPEVAAARVADSFEPSPRRWIKRLGGRLLQVLSGETAGESWSQGRLLARYSDRLFADILLPLYTGDDAALAQALVIARREDARLLGLLLAEGDDETPVGAEEDLRQAFERRCAEVSVDGVSVVEKGNLGEKLLARASLSDVMVVGRSFAASEGQGHLSPAVRALLEQRGRPVLVARDQATPLRRVLLLADGLRGDNQALFVATYLAEHWQASLTVLPGVRGSGDDLGGLRDYLAVHEVTATFLPVAESPGASVRRIAAEQNSDLIVMGAFQYGRFGRRRFDAELAGSLLNVGAPPLLICP
ncbi:MAG: hypothetical protein R3248_11170 [Candidatus Promineifilaceae bacterium]|nr:hypothetical protein [Candidatus Promineifilaceae bacterium]